MQIRAIFKPYDLNFIPEPQYEHKYTPKDVTELTLDGLKPSTEYELNLSAYSGREMGDVSTLRQFTLPASQEGKIRLKKKKSLYLKNFINKHTKSCSSYAKYSW